MYCAFGGCSAPSGRSERFSWVGPVCGSKGRASSRVIGMALSTPRAFNEWRNHLGTGQARDPMS